MEKEGNEKKYKLDREGGQKSIVINYEQNPIAPTLEDNDFCFQDVFNAILETGPATQIVLAEERNYVYPIEQTRIINEVVETYNYIFKEKNITKPIETKNEYSEVINRRIILELKKTLIDEYKKDPINAYLRILRQKRLLKIEIKDEEITQKKQALSEYHHKLEEFTKEFEKTKLYQQSKKYLPGYKIGDRTIYRIIFEPEIKPNFMHTRLQSQPPITSREIDLYKIDENTEVTIYENPKTVTKQYFIHPIEFKLTDQEYTLITQAREIIAKHKPRKEEFVNPDRMREVFKNISRDLLEQISTEKNYEISYNRLELLSKILVRLTVGFGLIEELLKDENIEDIYINPPVGQTPIIITHNKYGEMTTNILPNIRDVKGWASRFRLLSGRPLDESHPVMDTELFLPHARARVAIIQEPLSMRGLTMIFRKHRPRPWTLPLLAKVKAINAYAAGLLWFLTDGSRTMLIAGTRGSGKTALLGAIMVTIMRKYRIITVEDTQELPVNYLQRIGFNIVPLKVRSAILGEQNELSAADGIRTTLRMGDSALIVGEVRGEEALALYEAMRVGALANVVAGTIHGDSAYGIFDRVVNDLGVPTTSFKATDIIVLANKIKSPDGMKEYRRTLAITEVRKDWEKDPMREHAFVELMTYDARKDELVPTPALIEGESEVLKSIASRVKEWSKDWDKVIDNIIIRGQIVQILMDASDKHEMPELLESDFVVQSNDAFHKLIEKETNEHGYPKNDVILTQYQNWLKTNIKILQNKK